MSEPSTLLDKREARIRTMFGDIAGVYDLLNHLLSLNVDRYWRWRTTRLAPPAAEGPILDVCTGTGDLALAYDRAAGRRLPIVGADFCLPMLLPARAKARRRGAAERIRYVEADTQRLPFPSDHFQLTTVAFGLRNVTDTDRGLAEMVRVTRPGGRVAVLEFSRPRHWLFGRLYRFYFRRVLPLIGQLISRSRDSAYNYLPASVMEFPDGEALAERMRQHGLTEVRWHPLTFGIATLYVGVKPQREGGGPSTPFRSEPVMASPPTGPDFTLDDFRKQLEQAGLTDTFQGLLASLPAPDRPQESRADALARVFRLIDAMTAEERRDPAAIDEGRRQQIAAASGTEPAEVGEFLAQFLEVRALMRQLRGMSFGGR